MSSNNNNNNVNLKLSLTNKHPHSILTHAAPQHQPSLLQKSIVQKSQQSRLQTQQLQQSSSIPSVNLKNSSNTQLHVNFPPRYKFPPPVNQQKIVPQSLSVIVEKLSEMFL